MTGRSTITLISVRFFNILTDVSYGYRSFEILERGTAQARLVENGTRSMYDAKYLNINGRIFSFGGRSNQILVKTVYVLHEDLSGWFELHEDLAANFDQGSFVAYMPNTQ